MARIIKGPSCKKCSYEGVKILVFLYRDAVSALKWKTIDPHFRDPKGNRVDEAPSPDARFPASKMGWDDAIEYAKSKPNSTSVLQNE